MLVIFRNIFFLGILICLVVYALIIFKVQSTHHKPIYEYKTKIRFANAFQLTKLKDTDIDQLPNWLATSKNVQMHFEHNFLKEIYIESTIDDNYMIAKPGDFIVQDEEDRIWSCSYAWFHDNYDRL